MRPLMLTLLVLLCPALHAAENRSITVTARSEIKVAPDEVILVLGVHTRDKNLITAKRQNEDMASAILELAPVHAIPAVDVKVIDMNVSPDYGDYRTRPDKPIAYDFTRTIEVRLTDFEKIEPFLSDAFDRGLTRVGRFHFRVGNQRQHQFEARKLAVAYAREKAEHLTELTNMKLGSPIRIEEEVEDNWDAVGFGGSVGLSLPAAEDEKIASRRSPFHFTAFQAGDADNKAANALSAPGQITIFANVTVEFEMSPE